MVVSLLPPFIICHLAIAVSTVLLLAFFRTAANEYDEAFTVFTETNTVTWSKIDSALEHPGTDAFYVREITLSEPS
jgi:hypothetical protein